MQLSNYILLAIAEVYLVLMIVSALLLLQIRKQRQVIRRQQEKLQELIKELKRLKLQPPPAAPGTSYKTYLQAQQAATSKRLQGSGADLDVDASSSSHASEKQRALALRYQLLQIEEAAIERGDGPLQINWQYLEDQLAQLLNMARTDNQPIDQQDEIATYKKRIENLEKFKKLFFDMEKQWQLTQAQAQDYYAQLSAMADTTNNSAEFTHLLDSYRGAYQEISQHFIYGSNNFDNPPQPETKVVNVTRTDPRAGEEIIKLRNVAADQHRIINQLQRRLEEATTAEAREELANELQQQLQRQIRFVQESETCIKLLEDELASASEKLNRQQQQLETTTTYKEENTRLREALEKFTFESKDFMKNLMDLEKENAELKRASKQSMSDTSPTPPAHPEDPKILESQYLTLQQEYAALEEKYLELKLK